jgi:hypothetical protein
VDQQAAQILVPSFGDAEQACFSAGARLPWHEPKPGGEIARFAERLRLADRCDQSCGVQDADTRDAE